MVAGHETQVGVRLWAQRLQDDLHLIGFADLVALPSFEVIRGLARRQREAGSTLEKVPHFLEFLVLEGLVRLQGVENELVLEGLASFFS